MRTRPGTAALAVALWLISTAASAVELAQESSDVAGLFKAFRGSISAVASAPMREPPKYPIRLYATDDSNTSMCFISDDRVFTYSDGAILIPLYAKVFNVKAVNRITYQKSDAGGFFHLWIDDELVLSIGA